MKLKNHLYFILFFVLGLISQQSRNNLFVLSENSTSHCSAATHAHHEDDKKEKTCKDACHDDCNDPGCKCPHHQNIQTQSLSTIIPLFAISENFNKELSNQSFYYQEKKFTPIYLSIFTPPNI
jgi:hypothetical protein